MSDDFQIPGFVDAHSHAFQRALRGRVEGRDFWAWRDRMLELAARVHTDYHAVFEEMRDAGFTAVGEFHYLGLDEARAAAGAAREVGIELVVLYVAYARGGIERFRQPSVADYLRELEQLLHRGIGICIGSDSNVRIDPFEELRELDGIARRQSGRRDVLTVDALLSIGSDEGAASLGLETWPEITIDGSHPQLRNVDEPLCALVAGCSSAVVKG